jgi:hypothetical protein
VPALTNPRHEAMACALAEGKTQIEAHKLAGYPGRANSAPTKVANRSDVRARVQELQQARHRKEIQSDERAIDKAAIDKGWVVSRAKYVVDRSVRGSRPIFDDKGGTVGWQATSADNTAAINGLHLLAKMGGFLIEKVEVGQPGDFARMTNEELDGELIEIGKAIGLPEEAIKLVLLGEAT